MYRYHRININNYPQTALLIMISTHKTFFKINNIKMVLLYRVIILILAF